MNKVSVIIPTYNEEQRISTVLKSVKGHHLIREIIVVNDGSSDKTSEVVKKFSYVKLIEFRKNKGKITAMKKGCEAAKSNIVLFLDADLRNLTHKNITDLIKPVLDKKVDVTISLRGNNYGISSFWKLIKFDFVSGERCLDKKIIFEISKISNIGYSDTILMNEYILENNLKFAVVNIMNTIAIPKSRKIGFFTGVFRDMEMGGEFAKALSFRKIIFQIIKMNKKKILYKF